MGEQVRQGRALGRPGIVAAMQALVDEPLEAAVVVGHRGNLWRMMVTLGAAILVADLIPAGRSGLVAHLAILIGVFGALWTVGGAISDARSPLTLGLWAGTLAVSDGTVYVARNSFWTSRATAITASFPRAGSTVVLGEIRWARRDLAVTLPDATRVRLEAPLPITSAETRGAISSMGRPPEAQWRPNPANPAELRWWDGADLTTITTTNPSPPPTS